MVGTHSPWMEPEEVQAWGKWAARERAEGRMQGELVEWDPETLPEHLKNEKAVEENSKNLFQNVDELEDAEEGNFLLRRGGEDILRTDDDPGREENGGHQTNRFDDTSDLAFVTPGHAWFQQETNDENSSDLVDEDDSSTPSRETSTSVRGGNPMLGSSESPDGRVFVDYSQNEDLLTNRRVHFRDVVSMLSISNGSYSPATTAREYASSAARSVAEGLRTLSSAAVDEMLQMTAHAQARATFMYDWFQNRAALTVDPEEYRSPSLMPAPPRKSRSGSVVTSHGPLPALTDTSKDGTTTRTSSTTTNNNAGAADKSANPVSVTSTQSDSWFGAFPFSPPWQSYSEYRDAHPGHLKATALSLAAGEGGDGHGTGGHNSSPKEHDKQHSHEMYLEQKLNLLKECRRSPRDERYTVPARRKFVALVLPPPLRPLELNPHEVAWRSQYGRFLSTVGFLLWFGLVLSVFIFAALQPLRNASTPQGKWVDQVSSGTTDAVLEMHLHRDHERGTSNTEQGLLVNQGKAASGGGRPTSGGGRVADQKMLNIFPKEKDKIAFTVTDLERTLTKPLDLQSIVHENSEEVPAEVEILDLPHVYWQKPVVEAVDAETSQFSEKCSVANNMLIHPPPAMLFNRNLMY